MKALLSACMLGLIATVIVCSDVPSKNLFTPAYSQSEVVQKVQCRDCYQPQRRRARRPRRQQQCPTCY
jgi:hypothetical protein